MHRPYTRRLRAVRLAHLAWEAQQGFSTVTLIAAGVIGLVLLVLFLALLGNQWN
jgi:hypothetical protein